MLVFTQLPPYDVSDLKHFQEELSTALRQYYFSVASPSSDNRYVRITRGDRDTGIAYPVGYILGIYCAIADLDRGFLHSLVDATSKVIGLPDQDAKDTKFYAFLTYRLAIDGYFGYSSFRELLAHKVVPPFLFSMFTELMQKHHDVDYLVEPFGCHLRQGSLSTEITLMEAMFYMCRVDTGFSKDVLPSGPKDQLVDVFTSECAKLSDIGFVYGGMCTLSEQNYSLVTKPIRESVHTRKIVEDFFNYV